jgi:Flp pilus assembly protein TadD
MPNLPTPGTLRRLLIPALLLSAAAPALAQPSTGAVVQSLPQSSDPAELLAQALRTLTTEPRNLAALTAAGRNALILGDPNAAVGFFGRAQDIAPNDGRVKAGLGSALVQLEKPQDALRLFADASRLGVPDAEFAGDRGLAYDLTGDQRRAQADYQTVLAAHPDDDTARRRLALSQGISGQKATAIATLDPLIRKRDIAAWRAQTFVLAMDGDAKGANDITRIMLPQQATMLQPFLVRLASLTPAQKARAVHFGEMPATGATYTPTQVASVDAPATYASAPPRPTASAPRSDLAPLPAKTVPAPRATAPVQVATATPPASQPTPAPVTTSPAPAAYVAAPLAGIALTPAPQPGATAVAATPTPSSAPAPAPATSPPPVQVAQAMPSRPQVAGPPAPPPSDLPTPAAEGHYDLPHDAATRTPGRPAARPAPVPAKTVGTPVVHGKTAPASADTDATPAAPAKKPAKALAKAELASADDSPAKSTRKTAVRDEDADDAPAKGTKARPSAKAKTAAADDDADCTPAPAAKGRGHHARATARKTPSTACTRLATADNDSATAAKAKKGAKSRASTADDSDDAKPKTAKSARSKAGSDKAAPAKAGTERVYVQVAGGANRDDMDKAWAGVKKKAPELMKGRTPSTTPLKATNRLLVGPFKDEAEAQAFVNKMSAKGLSGFTFKSNKGQKVEKVDTGQ